MIRDITIGQYYQTDSVIHRLDPRVKLTGTLLYIITLFFIDSIIGYVVATLALVAVIKLSKVPFAFIVRGMKAIVFLLLITVVFNMFLTPGEPIISFWIFKLTKEGLRTALFMGWRLILLIIGSSLMTLTTTPNHLTDGLEKSLRASYRSDARSCFTRSACTRRGAKNRCGSGPERKWTPPGSKM